MPFLTRSEAAAMSEDERLAYLTYTILGEAVGEGMTGMLVVGQVIANRASDARFPPDPVAVAGQSWQFTANAPTDDGNIDNMKRLYPSSSREYQQAQAAARATIIDKTVPDITGGAVQYHTIGMGWPSTWPSSIKQHGFVDIGNHRIYPARPINPGEIPANLALATEYGVATMLDIRQQGLAPIRPAPLSATLRLQRETNRVAQAKANAPETIRRSRASAFASTLDPFEVDRPANANMIINRPEPAMKASMRAQLRATGAPNTTERTFALMSGDASLDGDAAVRVSTTRMRPAAVADAPWGVRESVAAVVASTDAAAGRNQMVMEGNPNIAGSVVAWLYPQVAEGQGEANQTGKGARAVPPPGQSIIERNPPPASTPDIPQSQIERNKPIVKVEPSGKVQVIPQSQIERSAPTVIAQANVEGNPQKAASLASQIATRRQADVQNMRAAEQTASDRARRAVAPPSSPIERNMAPKAAPPSSPIERNAPVRDVVREAVPLPVARPSRQVKLPTLLPSGAKANPIGVMPDFAELAKIPADPLRPATLKAPQPAATLQRDKARAADVLQPAEKVAPIPASQTERLAARTKLTPTMVEPIGPTTRPVVTTRPTTLAPQPAGVATRDAARSRAAVAKPAAKIAQTEINKALANPGNHNPAALAAIERGDKSYTASDGSVQPTTSISGKVRNTYGD